MRFEMRFCNASLLVLHMILLVGTAIGPIGGVIDADAFPVKQALQRTKTTNGLLNMIAVQIPIDLIEKMNEANEIFATSKDVRLLMRATCVYINWLRVILNQWNNRQTEATQLLVRFMEYVQFRSMQLAKKKVYAPKFNWPNLISSSELNNYTEEIIFDVSAAIKSLLVSKLPDEMDNGELLTERIAVWEDIYVQLLEKMLNHKNVWRSYQKYEILEAAHQEILHLKELKRFVDTDKRQFAKVFQDYDKYLDRLTILGAMDGLKFPPKPVNSFKLEDEKVKATADYFALPTNAVNPFAHLLEQHEHNQRVQQLLAPIELQTADANETRQQQQQVFLSSLNEHLFKDDPEKEDAVDEDISLFPPGWLQDWESTLLSDHQNPPPHGGLTTKTNDLEQSQHKTAVATSSHQQNKILAFQQHSADDRGRNKQEEKVKKMKTISSSMASEQQRTENFRQYQPQQYQQFDQDMKSKKRKALD